AENGATRTYTINVIRAERLFLRLTRLFIAGFDLYPEFDPEIFEYRLELSEFTTELDISAITDLENIPVDIIGADELEEGENLVIIRLRSADGSEEVEYKIIVIVPAQGFWAGLGITNVFGGVTPEMLVIGGVSVITFATVVMLIAEKVKEKKLFRVDTSDVVSEDMPDLVERMNIDELTADDNILEDCAKALDKLETVSSMSAGSKKKEGKRYM
ncbi:MAG: hypothetical protein FWC68_04505, partial [Oscillospiraceae bacterium]|nr:hypothetical protein [Oscillospiraceae bacterium]